MIRVSNPGRQNVFFFVLRNFQAGPGDTQPSGPLSLVEKLSRGDGDHSPQSGAKVKIEGSYTSAAICLNGVYQWQICSSGTVQCHTVCPSARRDLVCTFTFKCGTFRTLCRCHVFFMAIFRFYITYTGGRSVIETEHVCNSLQVTQTRIRKERGNYRIGRGIMIVSK